jgi:hypothetical protein
MWKLSKISRILDKIVKKLGPLLKPLAPCLIVGIHLKCSAMMYFQQKYLTILLSSYVLILALFNFFKAAVLKSNITLVQSNFGEGDICKICGIDKSRKRIHHCTICNTCIRKMDHHCPWIDNW